MAAFDIDDCEAKQNFVRIESCRKQLMKNGTSRQTTKGASTICKIPPMVPMFKIPVNKSTGTAPMANVFA